ncbi:flavin monoxygenase [Streptococcus pneumoniae]|nr:flavin monoxygenase [Streptococcus pneumoniae]SNP66762.1 flavin monoxygenase [Streptococcus pneumoniae]SNP90199.1 flavin monoxygenase [Streptococcus pneumoniae]VOZ41430.1 flavin monoxygenase [Streptococcus pneumoniae]VPO80831.1 flavin monoxygenase [Streptococcus pneumoniae]
MVELGISTFGEITELEGTGQTYSHAERIRQLVAEIELADKVGLDVYGIGEPIGRILQYQPQRLSWPLGQSIPRKSV